LKALLLRKITSKEAKRIGISGMDFSKKPSPIALFPNFIPIFASKKGRIYAHSQPSL
jgi:hypothetical protein